VILSRESIDRFKASSQLMNMLRHHDCIGVLAAKGLRGQACYVSINLCKLGLPIGQGIILGPCRE
jgi:hypothetical protein